MFDDAIDLVAEQFVKELSETRLKRPAKRTCVSCGKVYRSRYPILADPLYGCCSDDCLEDIRAIVNMFGSDL